jgi:hypothetical protein
MKLRTLVGIGIVGLVLPLGGLEAQVDFSRLELTGGIGGWSGDGLEAFDPGFYGQLTFFGGVSSTFAVGLTGTYADLPITVDGNSGSGDEVGLGVTLRKALGAPRTFRFFLDGYAGWSRIGTTVETFDVTSDGFVIGPGLGVEIPFAEKWNVIARGHYYYQSYGDVLLNEGINAGSADNAWRWGGQVGLSFGPIN